MDIQWQSSVDIAAPVDKVYTYLADFPKHCGWAQTLERWSRRNRATPAASALSTALTSARRCNLTVPPWPDAREGIEGHDGVRGYRSRSQ